MSTIKRDEIEPLAIFLSVLNVEEALATPATIADTVVTPINSTEFDVVLQVNQSIKNMQNVYKYLPVDSNDWINSLNSINQAPDFNVKVMWNSLDLYALANQSSGTPTNDSNYFFASSSFQYNNNNNLDATSSTDRSGNPVTNFGSDVPLYRAIIQPNNSTLYQTTNIAPQVDFVNELANAVFGTGGNNSSLFSNEPSLIQSYENAVFSGMINISANYTSNVGSSYGGVDTGSQNVDSNGNFSYDPSESNPNDNTNPSYNGLTSAFDVFNQLLNEPSRFELMRCVTSFVTGDVDFDVATYPFYSPTNTGDLGGGSDYLDTDSSNFSNVFGGSNDQIPPTGINLNINTAAEGYDPNIGGAIVYDSNVNTTGYAYLGGQTITIPSSSIKINLGTGNIDTTLQMQATFNTGYDSNNNSYNMPLLSTISITEVDSRIVDGTTVSVTLDSNCTTNFYPPDAPGAGGDYRIVAEGVTNNVGTIRLTAKDEIINQFNGDTTTYMKMPFIEDDIVQVVFTITSNANQLDASGDIIGTSVQRKVLMQCVLKSDESEFISGNYVYQSNI